MKIALIVAIALIFGGCADAKQIGDSVTVYIVNDATAPPVILCQARNLASKLFARAGVGIQWRTSHHMDPPASEDRAVVVHLMDRTPVNRKPGALGLSRPLEGVHITVFYDRVERLATGNDLPTLLAYVMVHEITHLLQGECRHSKSGIMKANWIGSDYYDITRDPFTEEDVELIHRGLLRRKTD